MIVFVQLFKNRIELYIYIYTAFYVRVGKRITESEYIFSMFHSICKERDEGGGMGDYYYS